MYPTTYAPAKYNPDGTIKRENEWGADWTDFFKSDGCIEEFLSLLSDAPICSTTINVAEESDNLLSEGRSNVAPVDINGAYINGRMYCTLFKLLFGKKNLTIVELNTL